MNTKALVGYACGFLVGCVLASVSTFVLVNHYGGTRACYLYEGPDQCALWYTHHPDGDITVEMWTQDHWEQGRMPSLCITRAAAQTRGDDRCPRWFVGVGA